MQGEEMRKALVCGTAPSAAVILLGLAFGFAEAAHAGDAGAHAGHHGHGLEVPAMDEQGRRLESYDLRHHMSKAELAGLREKIALYRAMTDREVEMNMNAMGPDYSWHISDPAMEGEIGVLVLAHGVGEHSDGMLRESLMPIGKRWPATIGFGMAMMSSAHLQAAVDDLVDRGARTIIIVDEGTTTAYNSLSRQWRYIFGMRDEHSYLAVPRVTAAGVDLVKVGHFNDHPVISDILYDHAYEVSRNPGNELVILVGHGPEEIEDNIPDLEIMQSHVDRIRARGDFADVRLINLQDDALVPIRESNVRQLRRWIQQANRQDQDVIVVALAAASHGVQNHIRQDLRGLEYRFADRGLSEHPRFVEWIEAVIEEAIAGLE